MQLKENKIYNYLAFFLISHLIIWTLVPTISNINLPLDTIEALAWGNNLDWGYSKHPPLSAWAVEIFFKIFGSHDWAYYLLSQIFITSTFLIIFKFSEDFFKNKIYSFLSILLLVGIYFYNFTTPEFNVYICVLPFLALTVFFCWRGINNNDYLNWILFGLFSGLGVLSHYLFFYLLAALVFFFIYLIIIKKFNIRCLISLYSFILVLIPHLVWLVDNNYTTITYAFQRTGIENLNSFFNHLIHPSIFFVKQIGILIPFFIMCLVIISNFKNKINLKDKKLLFLISITIIPLVLVFITSLVLGMKIRTMWMTPFYLFLGVLFVYVFKKKIVLRNWKYFFTVFLIFFILSPTTYLYISITQTDKRTDYPGRKVANMVQKKWDENFINKIALVAGDEWYGGNLSYHLKSRPKWDNISDDSKKISIKNIKGGFVIIGEFKVLSDICTGIFFKSENEGVCMIGKKK
jgi:4-amino-4-deoxy-L-arabinose transferase-like glycosyltransferase